MIPNIRYFLFGLFFCITFYIGKRIYVYHFDVNAPEIHLVGLEDKKGYIGDIACVLKGSSSYKVASFSMWIDDTLICQDFKINRKKFEHPISMQQSSLKDGHHTLKIELVDGTKHCNKSLLHQSFYMDNLPLQASLVALDYKVWQGRSLRVQVQTNKSVKSIIINTLSENFVAYPESKNSCIYETYIPIECEQDAGQYPFTVEVIDHVGNRVLLENKFQVIPVQFKKKIVHITGNKLQTELEFTQLQERDLEAALDKITKNSVQEKLWNGTFDIPLNLKGITTEFGVIRMSQERGRTVHKALDVISDLNSVIWASNHGVVVLKDRFTHAGNTVVIDHGFGIISMYFHLSDFADIQVGQKVKKGNPLGRMGMTGYAGGPHLHWEMRVNNVAIDPMQWTQRWI